MIGIENLLAGRMCMRHGIACRPTVLLAQHANVSSESAGARYVIVLTNPFDVILEFNTYSIGSPEQKGKKAKKGDLMNYTHTKKNREEEPKMRLKIACI